MAEALQWGILGTGRIAAALADAVSTSSTGKLVAVGSRSAESAESFAQQFSIPKRYGSYEAVLADPQVQMVYISLPNQLHAPWAIRCAQAGKHVLCEKPVALNADEAATIIDAARANDVFFMEAFMYRCHPQTARLAQLVRDGAVGEVRLIQANFSFMMAAQWRDRDVRLNAQWGGGGIMDVGCYTASIARLLAGAAQGQGPVEPIDVKGCAHVDAKHKVDYYAAAALRFPGDILATLACGIMLETDWTVRVWGTEGHIEVPNPWKPPARGAQFFVHRQGSAQPQTITVDAGAELYVIEADTVAAHVADRQAPAPCATWDDTMQNMRLLDAWRRTAGVI